MRYPSHRVGGTRCPTCCTYVRLAKNDAILDTAQAHSPTAEEKNGRSPSPAFLSPICGSLGLLSQAVRLERWTRQDAG